MIQKIQSQIFHDQYSLVWDSSRIETEKRENRLQICSKLNREIYFILSTVI